MPKPLGDAFTPQANIEAIAHRLDELLPRQAPLLDFVHHNTLHGFQHLPFHEALIAAKQLTGIPGYLPEDESRRLLRSGRISEDHLREAVDKAQDLEPHTIACRLPGRTIYRREIFSILLLYGIDPLTPEEFRWAVDEREALNAVQPDVPPGARHRLLESIKQHHGNAGLAGRENFVRELWEACLRRLDLEVENHPPDGLIGLSEFHAEQRLAEFDAHRSETDDGGPIVRTVQQAELQRRLNDWLNTLGEARSLRDLFLDVTGEDLLHAVVPDLIAYAGSFLDEGLAAWHPPERAQGFYAFWRQCFQEECVPDPVDAEIRQKLLQDTPETAVDALIAQLAHLGLPPPKWEGYLLRIALELPGWSGMMNWRNRHAGTDDHAAAPASTVDFLAVRLVLDRYRMTRICRDHWGISPDPASLERYFRLHISEFYVRSTHFCGALPEHLAAAAQRLLDHPRRNPADTPNWNHLADMIFTWEHRGGFPLPRRGTPHDEGWRLFRLSQHLGLTARDIDHLPRNDAEQLLVLGGDFPSSRRAQFWLDAYERHYRESIFTALSANRHCIAPRQPDQPPEAQLIFCMDDREESLRRHIEELNPSIETLGAAGFFGVAMYWRGLDDTHSAAYCPIAITPNHEVREVPKAGQDKPAALRRRARRLAAVLGCLVNQESKRNLLSTHLLIDLMAPFLALGSILKTLVGDAAPLTGMLRTARWLPEPLTELRISADAAAQPPTTPGPRPGYTDDEQAERVAAFLRSIGLTDGFAPLVVLIGHGSSSLNNPHLAAYNCGACSGRHGGPNARAFAAMANRGPVRELLNARGIVIPKNTWFVGMEHNTSDEHLSWFDLDVVPPVLRPSLHKLGLELDQARRSSAHERCRRFASAPRRANPARALKHVIARASDISQARPELGHATNATAIIGRRALTRGVFFDRRAFLISYDPAGDADGRLLEAILLAAAPVGAGINLEYYFSTVNPDRFGCGSKITHNVTGRFGVMDGASSDLRTGLPRQMTEIHEAMRLLVVVEQKSRLLERLLERQPSLTELVGNEWIRLASLDPDDGAIAVFAPDSGFEPWTPSGGDVPVCDSSAAWYQGRREPLAPALIRSPVPKHAVSAHV